MLSPKQYVAAMRRSRGCPTDLRYQVCLWPYPQADQSHIQIWRESWPHDPYTIPDKHLAIPVVHSDLPGVLVQVGTDAPKPRETVRRLLSV